MNKNECKLFLLVVVLIISIPVQAEDSVLSLDEQQGYEKKYVDEYDELGSKRRKISVCDI